MCIHCVRILLSEYEKKIELPVKTPFERCLTPDCGHRLEPAFFCAAYSDNMSAYISKKRIKFEQNKYSIAFTENCNEIQRVNMRMGLSSPCDRCIYDNTYRQPAFNLYICPECGFYIGENGEIGYTEKLANRPIIRYHHPETIEKLMRKAELIFTENESSSILSENEKRILESEGVYIDGQFTTSGEEKLRERILQKTKEEKWIKNLIKDRVSFIIQNGDWRESTRVNNVNYPPEFGTIFMDANVVLPALTHKNLEKLSECLNEKPCKVCNPLSHPCNLKAGSIILFLIMNGQILCKMNQLVISEIFSHLVELNHKTTEIEYYSSWWSAFRDSVAIYNFDDSTMHVATVIAKLYSELMSKEKGKGKGADIKDAYHYVFSVQHQVSYILSEDKFLKSIPDFRKIVAARGVEENISRSIEIYELNYPNIIKLHRLDDIKQGFKKLLLSNIEIVDRSSKFLNILKGKSIVRGKHQYGK